MSYAVIPICVVLGVVGMLRFNTNSKALEIWDGASWSSPAGASGAVSEITANDIAASFALMLG